MGEEGEEGEREEKKRDWKRGKKGRITYIDNKGRGEKERRGR